MLSNCAYHIFDYDEGCCYSIMLKNSHPCVEGAMHHDCPVCFEVIHASFLSFSSWCNIYSAWSKLNCKRDNMLICSIYSSQEMMWLFCHVVTLFTNTAWRKCGIIFSECWHFFFFLFSFLTITLLLYNLTDHLHIVFFIEQVCLPSLLEVCLWYVQGMGENWHGNCSYTYAGTLPK